MSINNCKTTISELIFVYDLVDVYSYLDLEVQIKKQIFLYSIQLC